MTGSVFSLRFVANLEENAFSNMGKQGLTSHAKGKKHQFTACSKNESYNLKVCRKGISKYEQCSKCWWWRDSGTINTIIRWKRGVTNVLFRVGIIHGLCSVTNENQMPKGRDTDRYILRDSVTEPEPVLKLAFMD